jgi:16S rRNA (uracil1498-N3)-methyltransferase
MRAVVLLVGPEAGLRQEEREGAVAAGAEPVRISDAILRIETAAVAGLAVIGLLRDRSAPPGS